MSQTVVVEFAAEEPPPPAALQRMRRVSRGLEILFLVLAVSFGLVGSALILEFPAGSEFSRELLRNRRRFDGSRLNSRGSSSAL